MAQLRFPSGRSAEEVVPREAADLAWMANLACLELRPHPVATMPARFAKLGDRHAGIDAAPCSLEALFELSARHEREGQGDAPWPPQYRKARNEPPRVQPSRRRRDPAGARPS